MAKAPRLGQGKSRLARDVGRVEALRINRGMHALTMRATLDPRWRTHLYLTPDGSHRIALWPRHVPRASQGEGDLGARLARALAQRRCVAVVGTDCPAMTRAHVASAFRALRRKPFALGPAEDGGFWLLAARDGAAAARAMQGVRWSTPHAASDVMLALGAHNVARLALLRDVDTIADWRAYRSAMRASNGA
jgi:glycosyltransferase A (GT-A) superfamily protein (DUF2064 family)